MNDDQSPQPGSFGEWVRRRREAKELTQEELEKLGDRPRPRGPLTLDQLAMLVPASGRTIREIEKGRRPPGEGLARELVKVLALEGEDKSAIVKWARGGPPPPDSKDRNEDTPASGEVERQHPAYQETDVTVVDDRDPTSGLQWRTYIPLLILVIGVALALIAATTNWSGRSAPPATKTPSAGPMDGIALQRFGASFAPVGLVLKDNEYTVTPPLGDDRYAHLWGGYQAGSRCTAEVGFDARMEGDTSSAGFGYAVAPRGTITNDQPGGWSVQNEWDGAEQGFFLRPVLLPSGASFKGETVARAPDVREWHHVRVVARGDENEVFIDDKSMGVFRSSPECGGVILRVWGGTVYIRNLIVPNR